MTPAQDVSAVHRDRSIAILDDGQILAITTWFDADGVTYDHADALSCVAGPDEDGRWWIIDLSQFETVATH